MKNILIIVADNGIERNIWIEAGRTNKAGAKAGALFKYLSMDEYRYNKLNFLIHNFQEKSEKKKEVEKKIDQKRKKEMLIEKHGEENYKELYEKEPSELRKE